MRLVLYKPLVRPEYLLDPFWSIYPGFSSLKAYLNVHEPECDVRTACTVAGIAAAQPDIVGISSVSEMWPRACDAVRQLRRDGFDGPILIGGPHITALPETLPAQADCGVVGQGEQPLLELVRAYKRTCQPDLSAIPGLAYWQGTGQLARTAPPVLPELDTLPVDVSEYPATCFNILTIRGCPYHCRHCVEHDTQGKLRYLSAERLLEIMKQRVVVTGNPEFFFQDDTFLAAPRRLERLHALMAQQNLLGAFRIRMVSLNANLVREHTVRLLKEIGVQALGMGAESLNPRVLEAFKRNVVKLGDIERTIRYAEQEGLPLGGRQVYGYPGETRDEMLDSIQRSRDFERFRGYRTWPSFVCQPLPGSLLWQDELDRGRVQPEMDFSTLRIDGDCRHFASEWFYGNEAQVPRAEFLRILGDHRLIDKHFFVSDAERNRLQPPQPQRGLRRTRWVVNSLLDVLEGKRSWRETSIGRRLTGRSEQAAHAGSNNNQPAVGATTPAASSGRCPHAVPSADAPRGPRPDDATKPPAPAMHTRASGANETSGVKSPSGAKYR